MFVVWVAQFISQMSIDMTLRLWADRTDGGFPGLEVDVRPHIVVISEMAVPLYCKGVRTLHCPLGTEIVCTEL